MYLLKGNIHSFEWGSTELLAGVMGRPSPTPEREAEAWFGAHPGGPSEILAGPSGAASALPHDLAEAISQDPAGQLGPDLAELPFLVKLLAADKALSIQAHPSKAQAEAGFAAENAAGLPAGDPTRNYQDKNHKPELLVALTEFHALAGFRPLAQTVELLRDLNVPELAPQCEALAAALPGADGASAEATESAALRGVLGEWLSLTPADAEKYVAALLKRCEQLSEEPGIVGEAARTVVELQRDYPSDPGILVALLLNRVSLRPGEAVFLAAGQLHAYLKGMGVEVMANSNNVLRGGLTAKHIDVAELLTILDASPLAEPRCEVFAGDGQSPAEYRTPVADFRVRTLRPGASMVVEEPAVVLAAGGELTVTSSTQELPVASGSAVWVGAADGRVSVTARGEGTRASEFDATAFIVTVGDAAALN